MEVVWWRGSESKKRATKFVFPFSYNKMLKNGQLDQQWKKDEIVHNAVYKINQQTLPNPAKIRWVINPMQVNPYFAQTSSRPPAPHHRFDYVAIMTKDGGMADEAYQLVSQGNCENDLSRLYASHQRWISSPNQRARFPHPKILVDEKIILRPECHMKWTALCSKLFESSLFKNSP